MPQHEQRRLYRDRGAKMAANPRRQSSDLRIQGGGEKAYRRAPGQTRKVLMVGTMPFSIELGRRSGRPRRRAPAPEAMARADEAVAVKDAALRVQAQIDHGAEVDVDAELSQGRGLFAGKGTAPGARARPGSRRRR